MSRESPLLRHLIERCGLGPLQEHGGCLQLETVPGLHTDLIRALRGVVLLEWVVPHPTRPTSLLCLAGPEAQGALHPDATWVRLNTLCVPAWTAQVSLDQIRDLEEDGVPWAGWAARRGLEMVSGLPRAGWEAPLVPGAASRRFVLDGEALEALIPDALERFSRPQRAPARVWGADGRRVIGRIDSLVWAGPERGYVGLGQVSASHLGAACRVGVWPDLDERQVPAQ